MAIAHGVARWLALTLVSVPLIGAAQQKSEHPKDTVPSEAAKRDYEFCAEAGQAPEQAIERCRAALRHGLSGRVAGRVHVLIGWAHWALGEPEPAAEAWRAARRFEPGDPYLALGVGLFLEAAERPADAEAAFGEAARAGLRADSDGLPDFVVGYGRGQLTWENLAHVLNRLAAGLAAEGLAAAAHEARVGACDIYQRAPGKVAEALACRRQLVPRGEDEAQAHLDLARSLMDDGRYGLGEAILSFREVVRLDPTLAAGHFGLAHALEKQHDPEGALASYREALRLDPSLSEARQAIASFEALGFGRQAGSPAHAGQLDNPAAVAELRRCIDHGQSVACRRAIALGLSPLRAARGWTFLGMALESELGAEDTEEVARKAYLEALRVQPDYALAHYQLALLDRYGRPRDAIAGFESALRLRPDWDAAREALARVLAREGQWERAAQWLQEVVASRPGDPRAARELADALVAAGRWADAIPHLEVVCRSPLATAGNLVRLGQALQKSDRPAEARAAFLRALDAPDEEPGSNNAGIRRSWALNGLDSLGNLEDGIAARRRWLASAPELQPDVVAAKLLADAWSEARSPYRSLHLETAAALEKLGRHTEAEQEQERLLTPFRNAVTRAATRPEVREAYADALAEVGRTEEAIEETRRAALLEPQRSVWHRSLTLRLERASRFGEALEAAERWQALDPTDDEPIRASARILVQLDRDAEAIELLERSAESTKDPSAIAGMLVDVLQSCGRADEALPWWRRWFESVPGPRLPFAAGWASESAVAAAETYRKAAVRRPDDPVPECALGLTLWQRDWKSEEAIEAFRRCAVKGPRLAWTQAELGVRLSRLGQHAEAVARLEAAVRIEPEFLQGWGQHYRGALEASQAALKDALAQ